MTVLENGSEICGDYFNDTGFNRPIVIKEKTGLGVKVPPPNFTIYDVEQKVGKYYFPNFQSFSKKYCTIVLVLYEIFCLKEMRVLFNRGSRLFIIDPKKSGNQFVVFKVRSMYNDNYCQNFKVHRLSQF